MQILAGTSGYAYKEWKGPFYPERIAAGDMLGFYAERLPAVEINNTFYRMPKTSVLESWASQVPDAFRFSIKASRRITHFKRLVEAGDETEYLLGAAAALGERLGVLLFQLPPNLKLNLPRLESFLALLPEGTPAAFEFRHPSWSDETVCERLRGHGATWVQVDAEGEDEPPPVTTAATGYLRLRRSDYADPDLERWANRVRAAEWERAFVFFKHEDAGAGPRMASAFLDATRRRPASVRRVATGEREAG